MSQKSAPTFQFEFRSSTILVRWLWGMHGLALLACLGTPIGPAGQVALLAAVLTGLLFCLRRSRKPAVREIRVKSDGTWWITGGDGAVEHAVEVLGQTISSPRAVLLVWQCRQRTGRMLIFPDQLPDQQFRILHLALRLAKVC